MKKHIFILITLLSYTVAVSQSKIQKGIDSISLLIEKTKGETRNDHIFQLGQLYGLHSKDTISFSKEIIKAKAKNFKETAAFNFYMGLVSGYSEDNKYEEAEKFLEIALPYLSNPVNKGRFYRSKGLVLQEQSKFEKAQKAFAAAISYYETINNKEALQDCYHNMSASIQQLGQYEEAIALQQKSLKLAEQLDDLSGKAKCLNNISVLYQKLDNLEISEKYILEAIEIDESLQDKKGAAGSYVNLGIVNRKIALQDEDNVDRNRLKKARNSYKKALQIAEEIDYIAVKAAALANLANIENDYGNYNDAIKYGKESLAYSIEQNNIFGEMISKINLGYSYRLNKEYSKAEPQLESALAIAKKINFQAGIESCYNEMSFLYKEAKQFEKSISYYEDYIRLKDSLASVEVKKNLNELEVKFETEKKEHDLAETRANLAESELDVKNRNTYILGIVGLALLLGLIGYTYYYRQKQKNIQLEKENELKTAFAKIETQNKLQEQRLRISRDLHDNIGSQLTFVTSSIDNLKYRIRGKDDLVENKLQGISEFTTDTIYELRDTIWAMNKIEINFDDLQSRIANFIKKAGSSSDKIDFSLHISDEIDKESSFTSIVGMHIYRIIQEAVNNALKYANASKISVSFNETANGYKIAIIDNGKGFNLDTAEYGNGIKNMKKRAKEIGSKLNIKSEPSEGVEIDFVV